MPLQHGLLLTLIAAWFTLPGVVFAHFVYEGRPGRGLAAAFVGPVWGYGASSIVLLAMWTAGVRGPALLLAPLVAGAILAALCRAAARRAVAAGVPGRRRRGGLHPDHPDRGDRRPGRSRASPARCPTVARPTARISPPISSGEWPWPPSSRRATCRRSIRSITATTCTITGSRTCCRRPNTARCAAPSASSRSCWRTRWRSTSPS